MELSAIIERLEHQSKALQRIEEHLVRLNGRVLTLEKWQAATDTVLDSLNERVEINTTRSEENTSYIDQQKGGAAMRLQLITLIVALLSIVSLTMKLLLSKG